MMSRFWLRILHFLHLINLPRLEAQVAEEHASRARTERIRSGDFLDDLLSGRE
jgi:hypothetical protein